jgi:2-octaprenyl-6-methoxyphenol hydroxylase
MNVFFDTIIVGGGLMGATAALAFSQQKKKEKKIHIALIETHPIIHLPPTFDQRSIALSPASVIIYTQLGLWDSIKKIACPIHKIHISEGQRFGAIRFHSKDYSHDALGYVVPLNEIGRLLWEKINIQDNICVFSETQVINVEPQKPSLPLKLLCQDNKKSLSFSLKTSLLIAADGTFSPLAKQLSMIIERSDYQQHAIIANITTEKNHEYQAFERFTFDGSLALLPLKNQCLALIMCQNNHSTEKSMAYNDNDFKKNLQKRFGFRLGEIHKIGKRVSYPLGLHRAKCMYKNRVLLLGNSAHTLHPVAGQGFNLGLRDLAALIDIIQTEPFDLGGDLFFKHYLLMREKDWAMMIQSTHLLAHLFSYDWGCFQTLPSKLLFLSDKIPWIKNKMAQIAMGFSHS